MFGCHKRIIPVDWKLDGSSEAWLSPEYRQASSQLDIGQYKIVADQHFLSFHKVRSMAMSVDAPAVKPGPRHFLASAGDHDVVVLHIVVFFREVADEPLDDGQMPVGLKPQSEEPLEEVFVPEVLAVDVSAGMCGLPLLS